jgi:hypothetical protein
VAAVFAADAALLEAGRPSEGATFSRLGADGLVVQDVHFSDTMTLMAQLGD